MFILKFIPDIVFYAIFFAGFTGFCISLMLPKLLKIRLPSIGLLFLGTYMLGVVAANNWWLAKARELEAKVAVVEVASAAINTNVSKQVKVFKQQHETQQKEIITFIDREVVKYNNTCVLPQAVLDAHNKAIK
jgi:hypothetical protein